MKPEDMSQKCPECEARDKKISRRCSERVNPDAAYIAHMPQGDVTIIRCSNCGYIFQQCAHGKPPLDVKKILV
jgi:Cys-rich peptide (TIGR04165 family)